MPRARAPRRRICTAKRCVDDDGKSVKLAFSVSSFSYFCFFFCLSSQLVTILGAAFANNTNITALDVRSTGMGGAQAAALVAALTDARNTTLTKLWLSDNKLDSDGAALLATALQANESVQSLVLNGCNIGDRGVRALADACAQNKTLRALDLNYNPCTDTDIGKVRPSL